MNFGKGMNKLVKMIEPKRLVPDHREDRLINSWSKSIRGAGNKGSQLALCQFIRDDQPTLDLNPNPFDLFRPDNSLLLDCLIPYDALEDD